MSAFVVSKQHIDALVTTAAAWRMHRCATDQALGQLLWTENFASVNYRYTDQQPAETYTGPSAYSAKSLTPVQALKAIACYVYQSCEHPTWEQSEAYTFTEQFKSEAISRLPGYENADWEIRS